MKKILLLLTFALIFWGCADDSDDTNDPVGAGNTDSEMITDSFNSSALVEERDIVVFLPPGYDDSENASKDYPVFIFLHGANSTPEDYTAYAQLIMNNEYEDGAIQDMLVFMPYSNGGIFDDMENDMPGSPFYTNSVVNGNFEDYIIEDVIDYIDANYRTYGTADMRAIGGHSMGGYGSMKLAMKYPELFTAVAAHSGPVDFAHFSDLIPYVLEENGGSGPFTALTSTFTYLGWAMSTCFSPNPNNTMTYADFPIDNDGNIIDTTFVKWMDNDVASMAATLNAPNLDIYFDCGTNDDLHLYPFNTSFADSLDAYGIDYTFVTHSGNHSTAFATQFGFGLEFADSVFNANNATMVAGRF